MKERLKLVCLVKIVPDINDFTYDYEKNILVRDNAKSILNPADACAMAAALKLKKSYDAQMTVISMGPGSVFKHLEDLIRRGADEAVLITDHLYSGSDTYATARILARTIERCGYDIIFAGTHSMDGDTAHIPCQAAELLDVSVMSNVMKVREDTLSDTHVQVEVAADGQNVVLEMRWPAVLAVGSESRYKLPFVRYEDISKDVSEHITILTNRELKFKEDEAGLPGSKTKVIKTYPKKYTARQKVIVNNDDDGIEYVYRFLKEKGYV